MKKLGTKILLFIFALLGVIAFSCLSFEFRQAKATTYPNGSVYEVWEAQWNDMDGQYYILRDTVDKDLPPPGDIRGGDWGWNLGEGSLFINKTTYLAVSTGDQYYGITGNFTDSESLRLENVDTGAIVSLFKCYTGYCKDRDQNTFPTGIGGQVAYASVPAGKYRARYYNGRISWWLYGGYILSNARLRVTDSLKVKLNATTTNTSSINLSWNAYSGPSVSSYKLYRGSTLIYSGLASSFVDTGLAEGTNYNYKIVATNATMSAEDTASASTRSGSWGTMDVYYKDANGNNISAAVAPFHNLVVFNNTTTVVDGVSSNPMRGTCLDGKTCSALFSSITNNLYYDYFIKSRGYELIRMTLDGASVPVGQDNIMYFGVNQHKNLTMVFRTPNLPPTNITASASSVVITNPGLRFRATDPEGKNITYKYSVDNMLYNLNGGSATSGSFTGYSYAHGTLSQGVHTVYIKATDADGYESVGSWTFAISVPAGNVFVNLNGAPVGGGYTLRKPDTSVLSRNVSASFPGMSPGSYSVVANSVVGYNVIATPASGTLVNGGTLTFNINYSNNFSLWSFGVKQLSVSRGGVTASGARATYSVGGNSFKVDGSVRVGDVIYLDLQLKDASGNNQPSKIVAWSFKDSGGKELGRRNGTVGEKISLTMPTRSGKYTFAATFLDGNRTITGEIYIPAISNITAE